MNIEQLLTERAQALATHDGVPVGILQIHAAANQLQTELLRARDHLIHAPAPAETRAEDEEPARTPRKGKKAAVVEAVKEAPETPAESAVETETVEGAPAVEAPAIEAEEPPVAETEAAETAEALAPAETAEEPVAEAPVSEEPVIEEPAAGDPAPEAAATEA